MWSSCSNSRFDREEAIWKAFCDIEPSYSSWHVWPRPHWNCWNWKWQDTCLCPADDQAYQGPEANSRWWWTYRPCHCSDSRAGAPDLQGDQNICQSMWTYSCTYLWWRQCTRSAATAQKRLWNCRMHTRKDERRLGPLQWENHKFEKSKLCCFGRSWQNSWHGLRAANKSHASEL